MTKRTDQPAVDSACAMTRYNHSGTHLSDWAILAISGCVVLALIAEWRGWI